MSVSNGVTSSFDHLRPRDPRDALSGAAEPLILQCMEQLLGCIGIRASDIPHVRDAVLGVIRPGTVEEAERAGHQFLTANLGLVDPILANLRRRAARVVEQVEPLVAGDTILDCGAGDGLVGQSLALAQKGVTLYDIVDYRDSTVDLEFVCGREEAPSEIGKYDTSLLLTVLHHALDPAALFEWVLRHTTTRIVVIESVYGVDPADLLQLSQYADNTTTAKFALLAVADQRGFATYFDWFYNRVLHQDVQCPFNFQTPDSWSKWFGQFGVGVEARIMLGIDQPLVPEFHVLFALNCY